MGFALSLSLSPRNEGTPITMTQADGIMLGGNKDLLVDFDLLASNATVSKDHVVKFQAVASAKANLTMQEVMVYPSVKAITVDSCIVKSSSIPLGPGKLYSKLLSNYLTQISAKFNEKYV